MCDLVRGFILEIVVRKDGGFAGEDWNGGA